MKATFNKQMILFYKFITVLILGLLLSFHGHSQAPNWTVNENDFQNSMVAIISVSDECVPSASNLDMVGAFDITGEIRGVQLTDVDNKAFLTIYSMGAGEEIFFKVYDESTDQVYNIYDVTITFVSDGEVGTPPNPPLELNFDSNPQGASAGADQEVFNQTSTTLEAIGIGEWQVIFGEGGSFSTTSDPTATFTGVIGSRYTLAWTLSDTEGCIGETDEVEIILVLDEPENHTRTCTDGLDNDGDGLTDCSDPNCGLEDGITITQQDPTPVDCDNTIADGSINIIKPGAELYSLDMGTTTQANGTFNNLPFGLYSIWMQNSIANCIEIVEVELNNNFDPLESIGTIEIVGPNVICPGTENILYSLSSTPSIGTLAWVYEGQDGIVTGSNFAQFDLGENDTGGLLIATLTEDCGSLADTLIISIADPTICDATLCIKDLEVTNSMINSPNAPQVYKADLTIAINTQITNNNYEFSAGLGITFINGFSIEQGLQMIAEIEHCSSGSE